MRMTLPTQVYCSGCIALLSLFATGSVFSQTILTSASASITTAAPLLLQFQQNQQAIQQQMGQLIAQGDTPEEIFDWLNQNPSVLQAQQRLAVQLGTISAAQPVPMITSVTIPEGASPDLEDFLTAQASLVNFQAQIHNQLLQQGVVSGDRESALFEQQAGAAMQEQVQRAQTIAAESDQQPISAPPPLSIPANATPTLQAFLTLRDQLMRGEIAVHNQNLQVDMATRAAAIQAWREANETSFQQMQQMAQTLAAESSSQ